MVEEGGPFCHATIVSGEFGIAAVIGAHGATTRIPHGAEVEVDPERFDCSDFREAAPQLGGGSRSAASRWR